MRTFNSLAFLLALGGHSVQGHAQTTITGTLTGNPVWGIGGSPYIIDNNVTLASGATLTINPGVEVQLPTPSDNLLVQGTLLANGDPADRITFRGTNLPTQLRGGAIVLETGSGASEITDADFIRTGDFSSAGAAALAMDTSSATIKRCSFDDLERGISILTPVQPVVTDCTFSSNDQDVRAHAAAFTNFSGNGGLMEIFASTVTGAASWPKHTYRLEPLLTGVDVTVAAGGSLTIEPGAEVQLRIPATNLLVDGTLTAIGTSAEPVVFSGTDLPTQLRGGSVVLSPSSLNSQISDAQFNRTGDFSSAGTAALSIESGSAKIERCVFDDLERGISITTPVTPAVALCSFTSNDQDVLGHAGAFTNFDGNGGLMEIFSSTIAANATWPEHTFQIVLSSAGSDVTVASGTTLTIEAGAEVQLPTPTFNLLVDGTLNAVGTDASPIAFTGTQLATQLRGGSVVLRTASVNSILDRVEFFRTGDFSSVGMASLEIDTSSAKIERSSFIDAERGLLISNPVQPAVVDCTFDDNDQDVRGHAAAFTNFEANEGLMEILGSTVAANATWTKHRYEVVTGPTGSDVTVQSGVTLTIDPGAEIRLGVPSENLLVDGTLNCVGTSDEPIRFLGTQLATQLRGGSVVLGTSSTNSTFVQTRFNRLGDDSSAGQAALRIDGASTTVTSCVFTDAEADGIRVGGAASPTIRKSDFFDNDDFGVNNVGIGTVDAIENWWGEPSGPTNPANPGGTGDAVSANVLFSPFLTSPTRFDLFVVPDVVAGGGSVVFTTEFGTTGALVGLGLVLLNGVEIPLDPATLILGTFDANEQWNLPRGIPVSLAGSTLGFQSIGVDTCGVVRISPRALLTVQ